MNTGNFCGIILKASQGSFTPLDFIIYVILVWAQFSLQNKKLGFYRLTMCFIGIIMDQIKKKATIRPLQQSIHLQQQ